MVCRQAGQATASLARQGARWCRAQRLIPRGSGQERGRGNPSRKGRAEAQGVESYLSSRGPASV